MKRSDLKNIVRNVLLEKLINQPSVNGKLVKKTISFSGIKRECVCEGSVIDANEYATKHNLQFTKTNDSHFGGHYNGDVASYEFQPNKEFYGNMMETTMSAREQLARICGDNSKILTEVDAQKTEELVEFILSDNKFAQSTSNLVFEKIKINIKNKLFDKTQFIRLFEYLVNSASKVNGKNKISEVERKYAVSMLSNNFFQNLDAGNIKKEETQTKCGKKSFASGSAFENMKRIVSEHNIFL